MAALHEGGPAPSRDPEGHLLRRSAPGDDRAFGRRLEGDRDALRRYRDALRRYRAAVVRNAEDADGDVAVGAPGALFRGDEPLALGRRLLRVAHNRCVDRLRRQPPERPLDQEDADVAASIEDAVIRRDRLRTAPEDIERLTHSRRSAPVMSAQGGRVTEEIGSRLDAPPGTVKHPLYEGLRSPAFKEEGRAIDCEAARDRIAAGGRALGSRAVGPRIRACTGCRQRARAHRRSADGSRRRRARRPSLRLPSAPPPRRSPASTNRPGPSEPGRVAWVVTGADQAAAGRIARRVPRLVAREGTVPGRDGAARGGFATLRPSSTRLTGGLVDEAIAAAGRRGRKARPRAIGRRFARAQAGTGQVRPGFGTADAGACGPRPGDAGPFRPGRPARRTDGQPAGVVLRVGARPRRGGRPPRRRGARRPGWGAAQHTPGPLTPPEFEALPECSRMAGSRFDTASIEALHTIVCAEAAPLAGAEGGGGP